MNLEEKKYDAFISYRHKEIDQFVAVSLHKKLETFRLPEKVAKKAGCTKNRIERVFRDRDELPLASNLAEPITNALRNSEFLIVICTPELPKSQWCLREIETFIQFHGREKVFAVLAQGEPDEAFPDILRYVEVEETDAAGNRVLVKKEVEPLAADVRGADRREVRKKMDEEVVRLAAPMFGLSYDDLKQRHKEQRLKKIIRMSLMASAVCLLFGAVSTTMALRIQSQKNKIASQSDKIEEQYQDAMAENNLNQAENSMELLQEGDRMAAIQTAVNALPAGENADDTPYVAKAEYALANSLYSYENGYRTLPAYLLKQDAQISFVKISPDGNTMLVADIYGECTIWNVKEAEKMGTFSMEGQTYPLENQAQFLTDQEIAFINSAGIGVYDISAGKVTRTYDKTDVFAMELSKDRTCILVSAIDEVRILDTATLAEKFTYACPEGMDFSTAMMADEQEGVMVLAYEPNNDTTGPAHLLAFSLATFDLLQDYQVEYTDVSKIKIYHDHVLAVANEWLSGENVSMFTPRKGMVTCFSLTTGQEEWRYNDENSLLDVYADDAFSTEKIVFKTYSSVGTLSLKDGSKDYEYQYGDKIAAVGMTGENYLFTFTSAGIFHIINTEAYADFSREDRIICPFNRVETFLTGSDYNATYETGGTDVCIYQPVQGGNQKPINVTNRQITQVISNEDETRILVSGYSSDGGTNSAVLMDLETGKQIAEIPIGEFTVETGYLKDKKQFVVADYKKVRYFDSETGKEVSNVPLEGVRQMLPFSGDGRFLALEKGQQYCIYDVVSQKITVSMDQKDAMSELDKWALGNKASLYAIARKSSGNLEFYKADETTPYLEIPIKSACISYLNFDQDDGNLFVTYQDGKVEIYSTKDGSLIKTITGLEDLTLRIYSQKDLTILSGSVQSYVLDENYELTANVPYYQCYLPKKDSLITENMDELYMTPRYTLDMLLKEAKDLGITKTKSN